MDKITYLNTFVMDLVCKCIDNKVRLYTAKT